MITQRAHSAGGKVMADRQRSEAIRRYYQNPNRCLNCGNVIEIVGDSKAAEIRKKKFCNRSCSAIYSNKARTSKKKSIALSDRSKKRVSILSERTKGDIFSSRKNWQSARSSIRKHADIVYRLNGGRKVCEICGYSHYVEVCHIIAVSDFPDTATMSEINDRKNLIGLCPNHHWEFDHGLLNIAGNSTGVTESRPIT
jgi:hypothetical protein